MPFERDAANTRPVTTTDASGVLLDGGVRDWVWNGSAWVRAAQGLQDGGSVVITSVPTVNVGNLVSVTGILTINDIVEPVAVTGTINVVGVATVNLGSIGTINIGNTVNVLGTATVNLGSIGTINVGNTHAITGNVTATVNLGSIPTVNIGSSFPTFNVGNTVTVSGNVTATANWGSIGTVNVGLMPTVNVVHQVFTDLDTAIGTRDTLSIPSGALLVGGRTSDSPSMFEPLPLGRTGRSVLVESATEDPTLSLMLRELRMLRQDFEDWARLGEAREPSALER